MAFTDLREWLSAVEKKGELLRLSGASYDLEMSGLAELLASEGKTTMPVVLFDDVPGFPPGYRTVFGMLASPRRLAMSLGLPEKDVSRVSLVQSWRKKQKSLSLIPPRYVKSGAVQENTLKGKKIDLLKFPTPRFHEFDGGRYFGTAHVVITQDYNQSWVNVGVYRSMLVDKNRLALHMQSGHDGAIMFREYQARKQPMPMVMALGVDPALWFTGFTHLPWGVSEYDYTGGILGEALPVIKGPYTGLPIPANAEIAVEGELLPDEEVPEGPFGEWHGYYANLGLEKVPEPVVQVKSILFRSDPILTAVQLAKPPHEYTLARCLTQSGAVWDALDGCAVPGITGVWCHEAGAGSLLTIISLKTAYAGHSRQVGVIASQIPEVYGRYTIVVDEDVDPADLDDVMWVVSTRVDPERSIEILRYCRSANSDPAVSIEEKRKSRILYNSRCIIDACRPYDWKHESYPIVRMSPELRANLLKKWSKTLKGYLK